MDDSFSEFSNALAQNKSRVHVWRVENGILTEIADLGTFFSQSIYLVLEVLFQQDMKTKYTIYLWCGGFSIPDDEGPVTERIQVLFGLLNNVPSIHHEYEGFECESFLKAFIPYGGVRHRTPLLEYVTNRGFSSLFTLKTDPVPHWKEIPASTSALQPGDVNFLRTRTSFILWFGFESPLQARMRATELCGAFRLSVSRKDETRMVYQGSDDREFVRALCPTSIEVPKRAEIKPDPDQTRKEIYQVISKGQDLDFTLLAFKNDASLNICLNENAYILRDPKNVYVWFGKQQTKEAMSIGLVVAIMFMNKLGVPRNVHIQIVKAGESFSSIWET
ncbi:hypothetical protein TRFO_13072 [Tritrichomonas foetus]|uniref:Gelsolin-like domain-containing protein n=1 Tax=Tritrichomonas foetus TaxID=1144522 RepID=A0A1J4KZR5_9EUKA|nr:hypothetical protein TRFO_13072 [Tritrichomonas foetus]|eukprot:OHT16642.1 hypothetical protein TRFO_13072 [Tritrichomonas foetus]